MTKYTLENCQVFGCYVSPTSLCKDPRKVKIFVQKLEGITLKIDQ